MPEVAINECVCDKPVVNVPVRGMNFVVDADLFSSGTTGTEIDYSLEEQWTGKKWIDGKKIYQKTIDFGALPKNGDKHVNHGITGLERILHLEASCVASTIKTTMLLPHSSYSADAVALSVPIGDVFIRTYRDWGSYTDTYVTLFYICTDR